MIPGLEGRRFIVGGGAGDVGSAIVAQLLDHGAKVVVPARTPERARSLPDHPALSILDGFPDSEASLSTIRRSLAAFGPLHGAVAALGSWFDGPAMTELSLSEWEKILAGALTSHFLFARLVCPALVEGGQHVMINGGAALAPVPRSGAISVAAAAQLMMADVLRSEHRALGIHTLLCNTPVATRARPRPRASWVTSAEVGAICAWLFGDLGRLTAGSTVTLGPKPVAEP